MSFAEVTGISKTMLGQIDEGRIRNAMTRLSMVIHYSHGNGTSKNDNQVQRKKKHLL